MKFKTISLILLFCLLTGCLQNQPTAEQEVFVVKVPPFYDYKLSEEENYYRFRHFLFPQEEIPNPIPKGLPHDHSLLFISIEESGKLKINSEYAGEILDTKPVIERLKAVFREREKNGVYETGNWKVVKAVGIKIPNSTKYSDFIKVVDTVKQSGAEPVVLLFDDDARPKFKMSLNTDTEIRN